MQERAGEVSVTSRGYLSVGQGTKERDSLLSRVLVRQEEGTSPVISVQEEKE